MSSKNPRPLRLFLVALATVTLGQNSSLASSTRHDLIAYHPSLEELKASYQRADGLSKETSSRVFNIRLQVVWLEDGKRFWYRDDADKDHHAYVLVDTQTGKKGPAFDHERLAKSLSESMHEHVDPQKLPLRNLSFSKDSGTIKFEVEDHAWSCDLMTYELSKETLPPAPKVAFPAPWVQNTWPPETEPHLSTDGLWSSHIQGENVFLTPKGGQPVQVTHEGSANHYFARTLWSPTSKELLAIRVTPGDRKPVYLIQSSPLGGGRAKLRSRLYDLPGDKVDTFDFWLINPENGTEKAVQVDPVDYGDMPDIRWESDKRHFTYEKMDRGYSRWRIIEVDSETGTSKTLVDDHPSTFVDSTAAYVHYCQDSGEIIWRSERDGWGHLYLTSTDGLSTKQITKGEWVVRAVENVDEKARQILFSASGMNPKEDPYFIHYYRVNFDGTGLVSLTPSPGNHSAQLSPSRDSLVDTYSTINTPPVHELRRVSDGALLATLAKANIAPLIAAGWRAPEPFVAKGRDGKTDIWGVVFRPAHFDPRVSYPVIEDIYAGPQDSFVPKSFSAGNGQGMQALAELGFVVVKIDGMGTRNRSKAFHDVCYKNIADAGFPDRILWIKALAAKYPNLDIHQVGIYGTSAGGQNSTGAVLFHPEFYKVAVSSCGCHDNRMDKLWWNEQWMGYPVGPEYDAQSNITNADKLKGNLLLMVGELDTNVPPETTYRLVSALEAAHKDFDFVVISGSDHTSGGPYGERKRRDFFVRHLLGVEPPEWNLP
jgi:dipeptidyl aminopeptidase/acylaminoacyl peptidase